MLLPVCALLSNSILNPLVELRIAKRFTSSSRWIRLHAMLRRDTRSASEYIMLATAHLLRNSRQHRLSNNGDLDKNVMEKVPKVYYIGVLPAFDFNFVPLYVGLCFTCCTL